MQFANASHKLLQSKYGLQVALEDPTTVFQLHERIGRGSYGSVYKGAQAQATQQATNETFFFVFLRLQALITKALCVQSRLSRSTTNWPLLTCGGRWKFWPKPTTCENYKKKERTEMMPQALTHAHTAQHSAILRHVLSQRLPLDCHGVLWRRLRDRRLPHSARGPHGARDCLRVLRSAQGARRHAARA